MLLTNVLIGRMLIGLALAIPPYSFQKQASVVLAQNVTLSSSNIPNHEQRPNKLYIYVPTINEWWQASLVILAERHRLNIFLQNLPPNKWIRAPMAYMRVPRSNLVKIVFQSGHRLFVGEKLTLISIKSVCCWILGKTMAQRLYMSHKTIGTDLIWITER